MIMKSLLLKSLVTLALIAGTSAAYAGMCDGLKPEGGGTVAGDLIGEAVDFEFFLNSVAYTGSVNSNFGGGNSVVDPNAVEIIEASGSGNGSEWDIDGNNVLTSTFIDNNFLIEDLGAGDTITYFITFPNLTDKTITASFGPNNNFGPADIQPIGTNGFVITAIADGNSNLGFSSNNDLEIIIDVQEEGGATQEEIDAYTGCLDQRIDRLQNKIDERNNVRIPKLQAKKAHFEAKKAALDPNHCKTDKLIKVFDKIIARVMSRITKVQAKVAELEAKKQALIDERDNY